MVHLWVQILESRVNFENIRKNEKINQKSLQRKTGQRDLSDISSEVFFLFFFRVAYCSLQNIVAVQK